MNNILSQIKTFFHSSDFYKEIIEPRTAIKTLTQKIDTLEEKIVNASQIIQEIEDKAIIQPPKEEVIFDVMRHCYIGKETKHFYCARCYDEHNLLMHLQERCFCLKCQTYTALDTSERDMNI